MYIYIYILYIYIYRYIDTDLADEDDRLSSKPASADLAWPSLSPVNYTRQISNLTSALFVW
jgi:hypothetical protein